MPHDPSLDPYAILNSLGLQTVQAIIPITAGTDTAIWRVEHDQQTSALRVFRSSQVMTYQRELAAIEIAAQHTIPVPRVRAHGYWHAHPALLLEWCSGQPLASALRRRPWQLFKLARAFGQQQAHIHRITLPTLPDALGADWIRWQQAVDAELETKLRQQSSQAQHLLHLDYHPLNVLVQGTSVSAVLDWANAHLGDPRADVARSYTILVVEPHHPAGEAVWYRLIRRLLAQCWLSGYQAVAGELQDMALFFAWAGAVMCADLAPRVEDPHWWWQAQHLAIVQRWTQRWRKRVASSAR